MKSPVFFLDFREIDKEEMADGLSRLMDRLFPKDLIETGDLVALKLHFGEKGNNAYVKPSYLRSIIEKVDELGGKPFLTDTNTLYVGSRKESVTHIKTAMEHGFDYNSLGAPVIIADGLKGQSYAMVSIGKKWYKEVDVASDIHAADVLIGVTHFKCHELTGFGGAIKNLGMGCASVKGKLNQHSSVSPFVLETSCVGCMRCLSWCPSEGAIVKTAEGKVTINPEKCIGCGECILSCRLGAIKIKWDADVESIQEKMAEHVYGALKGKEGKSAFITFITDVSPACDCYPFNDAPIVRDIGILVSGDPVAIDQAAADLVNGEEGNEGGKLTSNFAPGEDKFRGVYPDIDWSVQLRYAEEIGLGSRQYELFRV